MNRTIVWAFCLVACLCLLAVPTQSAFAGSSFLDLEFYSIRDTLRDTTARVVAMSILPEPESEDMAFTIYTQRDGGTPQWSESIPGVPVGTDGLVKVTLGTIEPMDENLFASGQMLYLEVVIEGATLSPRIGLVSEQNVLLLKKETVGAELLPVRSAGLTSDGASASSGALFSSTVRTSAIFRDAGANPFDLSSFQPRQIPERVVDALKWRRGNAVLRGAPR